MKRVPICLAGVFVLVPLLLSCTKESDSPAHSANSVQDRTAIEQVFQQYRGGIAQSDGARVCKLSVTGDKNDYQHYRDWALTATKDELSKLRIDQQRQVLFYRLRLTAAQLDEMDGAALFAHAVNEEWVGKDSVAALALGAITIRGDQATAKVVAGGKPTNTEFDFVKEDGEWHLDLSAFGARTGKQFSEQVLKSGQPIEQYLLEDLTELEGEPVDATVWNPLK